MKPKYSLKLTPAAEEDLDGIYSYILGTLLAHVAAQNLRQKVKSWLLTLRDNPYLCEISRNDILAKKGYRRLVADNFVGLCLIDEARKMVIAARFFYGAMDYKKHI